MDDADCPIDGSFSQVDSGKETGLELFPINDEDIIPQNRSVPCRR